MAKHRIERDDYATKAPVRKLTRKPRAKAKKSPVRVNVVIQQDLQQPTQLNIAIAAKVDLVRLALSFFGC